MTGDHPPATHEPDRPDQPPPSPPPPPDTGPEPPGPGMPPKPDGGDADPNQVQAAAQETARSAIMSEDGQLTVLTPDPGMLGES
jgi:hypothetical protein